MLISDYIVRLAVAISTLALLSSIPAAAQATAPPKLSPQQLNPSTRNGNKPIAGPKAPTVYSPNGNKLIAAPTASGTGALQRPVPHRVDMNPRGSVGPASDDSNTPSFGVPNYGGSGLSFGPVKLPPCPGGYPRGPAGYC